MISRAIASCVVVLLLSLSTFAQFDSRRQNNTLNQGTLTVTVRDAHGQPSADARVEVRDLQFGRVTRSGYTNAAGVAEFIGIPHGSYDVVTTKGLNQHTSTLAIHSMGVSVDVDFSAASGTEAGGKNTVSVAQYKVPGKARKELQKAQKALAERKLEEAEERIAKALEIYPKYSDALTARAIIRLDQNQVDVAQADLDKALEYDPANALAYLVYGASLNVQSKFERAIETLERGKSLDPTLWQAYFELGKAYIGKAEYKQALKNLDKAQTLVQFKYPNLHLVKAHALLSLKDYAPAMTELEAFLEQSPDAPQSENARKTLAEVKAFLAR